MLYQLHEFQRAMLSPLTAWAQAASKSFANPSSPLSLMPGATRMAAAYELLYRLGKDYEKPEFNLHQIVKEGHNIPIVEQTIVEKPFCRLLRFKRYSDDAGAVTQLKDEPVVLVCAPLSGHHSTLLRDTVRTLLQDHKVYITDWIDARMVPVETGPFHLDDYVAYIQEFIRHIGARNLHVISVCQPTVPVLAAISLMASRGEDTPLTMTMMGGPIDARRSPTSVNSLATQHSISWFENNVIHTVPANYPGEGRHVYPGFLQHAGFVAMNPERHAASHWDFYQSLLRGDEDDAEAHRNFYDEYNAVLDMAAEYYLETIRIVFQEFRLAEGTWEINGELVRPQDIKHTALMTIEGELDDISGSGQTHVAHELCTGIPPDQRRNLTAEKCGHYGIFSGRRWRTIIYPQLRDFIREHAPEPKHGAAKDRPDAQPAAPLAAVPAANAPAGSAKTAAAKRARAKTPAATAPAKAPAAKRVGTRAKPARTRKAA
ncbi:esterase [Burkholderia ubonensis]|uniref:Esterase n=1 Tax=Burkholderia ubonensis TaxID=101571 RepID=A0AAW3MNV6_9BURK|nr:polyhydroxyalkanoate depolymerase [Burkholderia ubonensis]KVP90431.1 esterase [Burkholderia ubonensis]KVX17185.1 esterase [Burkholderia ubonensis]KVZ95201.1 esterase [Burkholderia ubonensis]KWD50079.1 esterase [Burkholderia ubonensis]KWD55530.1 esterase [Burkholderia ubonensis]